MMQGEPGYDLWRPWSTYIDDAYGYGQIVNEGIAVALGSWVRWNAMDTHFLERVCDRMGMQKKGSMCRKTGLGRRDEGCCWLWWEGSL